MFRGKKYKDSAKQIDRAVQYAPADALGLVVKTAPAKFDETVEIHIKLGVDQQMRDFGQASTAIQAFADVL